MAWLCLPMPKQRRTRPKAAHRPTTKASDEAVRLTALKGLRAVDAIDVVIRQYDLKKHERVGLKPRNIQQRAVTLLQKAGAKQRPHAKPRKTILKVVKTGKGSRRTPMQRLAEVRLQSWRRGNFERAFQLAVNREIAERRKPEREVKIETICAQETKAASTRAMLQPHEGWDRDVPCMTEKINPDRVRRYAQEMDGLYAQVKPALYDQADYIETEFKRTLTKKDVGLILNGKDTWPLERRPMKKTMGPECIGRVWEADPVTGKAPPSFLAHVKEFHRFDFDTRYSVDANIVQLNKEHHGAFDQLLPRKFARLFWRNASTPSSPSSPFAAAEIARDSCSSCVSRLADSNSSRFTSPKAPTAPSASCFAKASAVFSTSLSGTTCVASPHSKASCALSCRLVRNSSRARRWPTWRCTKYVDEESGVSPAAVKAEDTLALLPRIARSAAAIWPRPPPATTPFTAAMTGLDIRAKRDSAAWYEEVMSLR